MKKSKRRQTPQRRALRPRRTQPLKREVNAAELPVRYRAAVLQNITDRNERLSALKAAALRSDLQRIEAMMMDAPPHAAVTATVKRIRDDLTALSSKSLP